MPSRPDEDAAPIPAEQLRLLKAYADSLPQPIFEVGPDLRLRFANRAALEAFGYSESELGPGFFVLDLLEPDERDIGAERVRQMFGGSPLLPREYVARRKDGSTFPALIFSRAIFDGGALVGLRGIIEDVTERKRFEAELVAHSRRQATAARLAQIALDTTVVSALFGEVAAQVAETLDVELAGVFEHRPASDRFILRAGVGWQEGVIGRETTPGGLESLNGFALNGGTPVVVDDLEHDTRFTVPEILRSHGARSGLAVAIAVEGRPWGVLSVYSGHVRSFTTDEAHFAVAAASVVASALARQALEEQLVVSQKMEAVGRLAGGVAHDFNNILTVVRGCADLLLRDDSPGSARTCGAEIRDAAERAVSLTQQLLSVSRRQVVLPRVVDLRSVLDALAEMLKRLIGEDVVLTIESADDLGAVRADPGQIEQVILNLTVNARDAMPGGGRLHVALDNLEATEASELPPGLTGAFVRMTVADTGQGMDEETLRHVFEPFFTTKERGKGTGLGLSTAYAIVEQAGGHITVASEPGGGSTFIVLLPRVDDRAAASSAGAPAPAGTMTVLLVEDDDAVRSVTRRLLAQPDRTVLEASGLRDALDVASRHPGPIDLLITDVIMPGGSGALLADRLRRDRPGLRVLYMSGYTDESLAPHNVLDPDSAFIQKPFDAARLQAAVLDVLDPGRRRP